jgi:hypothetical protein
MANNYGIEVLQFYKRMKHDGLEQVPLIFLLFCFELYWSIYQKGPLQDFSKFDFQV